MNRPLLFVMGTRPEGIKLIPLYKKLKEAGYNALLCASSQHRQMLQEVFTVFDVVPDFDLDIMRDSQDLFYITRAVLREIQPVLEQVKPAFIFVHGDTTTTFAAGLAAFYKQIPLIHVEAGLRTGNMHHPFPEEMNRKVVGQLASIHFAPTSFSVANLLSEGIDRRTVFCVGNTVVDALYAIKHSIEQNPALLDPKIVQVITQCKKKYKKLFLVTAHRREAYGQKLENIFHALTDFALQHQDEIGFIHPMHPNPAVKAAVEKTGFHAASNVVVLSSISYVNMVYLLSHIDYIATDSGGLQEEGASFGKPVICLREVTERYEGVWDGIEILAGTDPENIIEACNQILKKTDDKPSTVYGDGKACARIISILENQFFNNKTLLSDDHRLSRPLFNIYKEKQG
jgi:UDP-N-acetylglucosamine 2-epimerase